MKNDGIIFDMDGVLVDVSQSYREVIRLTAGYFLKRKVNKEEVDAVKKLPGMNNDWDATYALINDRNIPYKRVMDYFQLIYLGSDSREGLIKKEKLLIPKIKLQQLKIKYGKVGIATGRPRKEALLAVDNFNLKKIFSSENIVALEDASKEKPDPEPLLEIKKRMKVKNPVYIGDTINDVIAAKGAKMPCIFIGTEKLGDIQIANVNDLMEVLL